LNSKLKKLLFWVFIIFFVIPLVISIIAVMFVEDSDESQSKGLTCNTATTEDLKNIREGLIADTVSISSGFASDFSASDIDEITSIFPTFKSPRVVAAQIEGAGDQTIIGLWGIQDFDYGWRILALNQVAKEYSNHGVDVEDDSASGRARTKMLELSSNTSAPNCAKG